MYRPEIKVLDCTLRDGGIMNNWEFDKPMVKDVFENLVASGVDYIEMGYRHDKAQFPPDKSGPWRYCDEQDLRDVVGNLAEKVGIAVMLDVEDAVGVMHQAEELSEIVEENL